MDVKFQQLHPDAVIPAYAKPGDAGLDLYTLDERVLMHGESNSFRTGIAVAIPEGYAGLILPRSGLAFKHQITVVNAPGLIDSGYRGEIVVGLMNHGATYRVERGHKIAQLVIQPVAQVTLVQAEELSSTARGTGGFGSTGW